LSGLKNSGEWIGGEVACILEVERDKGPRIVEYLLLETDGYTKDELKLLYLNRSLEGTGKSVERETLSQYFMTLAQPHNFQNKVVVVEESSEVDDPRDLVHCLAKRYKPVALKV
jgi:hypothetical protein